MLHHFFCLNIIITPITEYWVNRRDILKATGILLMPEVLNAIEQPESLVAWQAPFGSPYRIVELFYQGSDIVASIADVFKQPLNNRTQLWNVTQNKMLLNTNAETIRGVAQRTKDDVIETFLGMEHGTLQSVLVKKGQAHLHKHTGIRWSVTGEMWRGRPVTGGNNALTANGFLDAPKIVNMNTGKHIMEIPVVGFPQNLTTIRRKLYMSIYFALRNEDFGVWNHKGTQIVRGDYMSVCGVENVLYAGQGGFRASGKGGPGGGKLFRINPRKIKVKIVYDSGCARCQKIVYDGKDHIYVAWAEPYKVVQHNIRTKETKVLFTSSAILPYNWHSFGISIALKDNGRKLAIGWTDQYTPKVKEIRLK